MSSQLSVDFQPFGKDFPYECGIMLDALENTTVIHGVENARKIQAIFDKAVQNQRTFSLQWQEEYGGDTAIPTALCIFNLTAIMQWADEHPECPLCRSKMTMDSQSDSYFASLLDPLHKLFLGGNYSRTLGGYTFPALDLVGIHASLQEIAGENLNFPLTQDALNSYAATAPQLVERYERFLQSRIERISLGERLSLPDLYKAQYGRIAARIRGNLGGIAFFAIVFGIAIYTFRVISRLNAYFGLVNTSWLIPGRCY